MRKTEKVAQRYQLAGHGLALELLTIKAREKIHQIIAADGFETDFALAGKLVKLYKIAAIGGYRVGRKALLHAHMGQKRRNGCGNFHQLSRYPSPEPAVRRVAIP